MARPFDPIRLLKELSNELLRKLFHREGARLQIPWADLSPRDIAPIVLLWETMPESRRQRIHVILQEVHSLGDERGLRVLTEELAWKHPEKLHRFSRWDGRLDKVLWAHLYTPDVFDEAAIFARADTLAVGRYWQRWNGLPPKPIAVTPAQIGQLQQELQKYYWPKELRGRHCRVHHHSRGNGVDYFFAYLDDWPDKLLRFDNDGQMEPRAERYAFTNVFAYDADQGCIDLVAKGGRAVHLRLRQAFCRAILNLDVDDEEPTKPAYRLDHLLDPVLALPTDPADQIAAVRLCRIRLAPRHVTNAVSYEELGFSTHTTLNMVSTELRERLADQGLSPGLVTVKQAAFQLQFHGNGRSRPRSLSFQVSVPNSCDLKSKPDELRAVGERCLKRWRIVNA